MRNIFLLSCAVLSISGCDLLWSDDRPSPYRGTATATLNGEVEGWQTQSYVSYFEDIDKYVVRHELNNDAGELRQVLSMSLFTPEPDTIYPYVDLPNSTRIFSEPNATFTQLTADGDAICGFFDLYEEYPNIVIIDEFDVERHYLRGRFELAYFLTSGNYPETTLDTIFLTDGVFEIDGLTEF